MYGLLKYYKLIGFVEMGNSTQTVEQKFDQFLTSAVYWLV